MSQARDAAVKEVLSDLEAAFPACAVALLTRSGSVYGGRVPQGATPESFAAMMAVLHGAAEAGTEGLGGEVEAVAARLKAGAVFTLPAGRKMLLVVHFPDAAAAGGAQDRLAEAAKALAALF